EDGFPEVGELPFYCLWVARGVIDPATGDISWRKPERLTSGRRDVYQISINGANNVGFGVIWQEDPEGVRPGEMAGPGHGWSGATTNHKTDIWYSFIKWSDFAAIDTAFTPNGDPQHSFDDPEWTTNRPMPLVPFAMPLRMSDNDVCNTDNMKVELGEDGLPVTDESGQYIPLMDEDGKHAGTHRYCYLQPGLCTAFHTFENSQDATKNVCVTADGRLLDGDTGASRPNLSFMPYTKPDGTQSAWIAIAYEETKGVGAGKPEWDDDPDTTHGEEKDKPDLGKNVIYHSFDFASPVKVAGGDIVNLPALDEAGNLLYLVDKEGSQVLDFLGRPQLAYENARRPRMLVQPAGQAGSSGTVMAMVYKQGEEGKGRPSDIMLRRVKKGASGNPYAFANFVCNARVIALNGKTVCVDGAQNLSSVTPTETWTNPDQDDNAKGEGLKVVKYEQTAANLADASWTNPYDDARAHRGILRGNNLFLAYDYTPNWAASRNAHDKYDLFIRRSFDGGQTWTTDPAATEDVCHTRIWKDYTNDEDGTPLVSEDEANKKDTYEEVVCFGKGEFEPARNMSQLKNNKLSVIEPRLVGPPSSTPGSAYPEDAENRNVFYVTFGTATNVPKAHGNDDDEEEEEHAAPADLFYTFTRDRGQTFFKRLWEVNPDSSGNYAGETVERTDYLAKGDPEQGEAQIRMVPDGSRFYAVWNQEGEEGSDTWFRRIMSMDFPQNVSPETVVEPEMP
ncbi:MAG: choice-of-anchor O protein, partial [Chromatiaceae bacterium]|nr:choice-of-anchor O protein [Chromatiaceae bacterium]